MGAKNWTTCPQCFKVAEAERLANLKRANDGYGKLPPDVYQELIRLGNVPTVITSTLREDYQLGMTVHGTFVIRYRCVCESCGFEYKFSRDELTRVA